MNAVAPSPPTVARRTGPAHLIRLLVVVLAAAVLVPLTSYGPAGSAHAAVLATNRVSFLNVKERMNAGDVIWSDVDVVRLTQTHLEMQYDGNLVLYRRYLFGARAGQDDVLWATNTQGVGNWAEMNVLGNFVLHNVVNTIIRRAHPRTDPFQWSAVLKVQSDDKMVIYSGEPFWVPLYQSCEWVRNLRPNVGFC